MVTLVEKSVGQVAAEYPEATQVFDRYGIDFCCGGGTALEIACEERGLDLLQVLSEIREARQRRVRPERRWDRASALDLVDHILEDFHEPLRQELPRLEALAKKFHEVHGAKDPVGFAEILRQVIALRRELELHMAKEEQILFPMIQRGVGAAAGSPIRVMRQEHDEAGAALARLRELTHDFTVPEDACNTWRALWAGLADLEHNLHEHIHLENNLLFPMVLGD